MRPRQINTLLLLLLLPAINFAQKEPAGKETLLKAIKETADCAADVLLDANGRSRCDYNITEGKWYDYEPPWHTGQLIYGLVEAYKITNNKKYLARAEKAGDWWCSLEIKDHPKLKGMVKAIHGEDNPNIVFATVTDGTAGLFKLYDLTKKKKYADVPVSAGEWMLNNMYVPEQKVFYDNVDPVTGEVLKNSSPFSADKKEISLFDVSRPNNEGSLYRDMYRYSKNEKYKKIFIDLCESLVEKQDPNGLWMRFIPNKEKDESFHPRFNLWYAESLIDGYDMTGDKRYLDAAIKTLRTYQKAMQKDGTFYYVNYLDGRFNENSVTGSATAFCGLLWIRLIKLGAGNEFASSLDKAVTWILQNRFSPNHPDKNLRGSVIDTRTRRKNGNIWLTQRDVGTSFGLRFLADYYNYKYGKN